MGLKTPLRRYGDAWGKEGIQWKRWVSFRWCIICSLTSIWTADSSCDGALLSQACWACANDLHPVLTGATGLCRRECLWLTHYILWKGLGNRRQPCRSEVFFRVRKEACTHTGTLFCLQANKKILGTQFFLDCHSAASFTSISLLALMTLPNLPISLTFCSLIWTPFLDQIQWL